MKKYHAKNLYLIIRGPKPEINKVPFHPIVLCSDIHTARWEAGDSANGATVLTAGAEIGCNWRIERYKGYDLAFVSVVYHFKLFDGTDTRDFSDVDKVTPLLESAVWWSWRPIPQFLKDLGVRRPSDAFSLARIEEDNGLCLLTPGMAERMVRQKHRYQNPRPAGSREKP